MSSSSYNLRTEFSNYANVLVIDETGEYSAILVEKLLGANCSLNYFGKESRNSFSYLSSRKEFQYLNSFSEIDSLKKIDYLFYLPAPFGVNLPLPKLAESVFRGALIKERDLFRLTQENACKILVCCAVDSMAIEKYQGLVGERGLNARLAVFDCLYGPGIKLGLLGELFRAGVSGYPAKIPWPAEEPIFPLSAEALVGEIISLAFSPQTKGQAYFLEGRQTNLADFINSLKQFWPGMTVDFLPAERKRRKGKEWGLEELLVNENWEEGLVKTVDWFQKTFPPPAPPTVSLSQTKTILPKKELVLPEELSKPPSFTPEPLLEPPLPPEPRENEKEKKPTLPEFLVQEKLPSRREKKTEADRLAVSTPRKLFWGLGIFLFLSFSFFILPLFLAGTLGLWGMKELEGARQAVDRGGFSLALKKSHSGEKFLNFSQRLLLTTSPFYALVGFDKQVAVVVAVFQFSQNLNETLQFALLASQDLFAWTDNFFEGGEVNQPEILGSIKANLASAYEQASLAQSSLAAVEPGFKYLKQTTQYEKLKNYLPESREILIKGQSLLALFPEILGFSGRKTYLILFQNNAELRPTGGFIGSYAIVNLENGKLVGFEVFDVYQADGQLKGHVEPPAKLKEYLGEANWFLRDSNWDPDFAVSAQRAQWFLDKELQVTTDGVMAVTLETARKILAALGEVEVLDYQEKVNQDNLFQKAEYYSELGSFPGSTQKKDFLGSLFQSLFERIKNAEEGELMEVGGALFSSLEQKEILFYFNDAAVQKVVGSLNWSGNIREYQPKAGLVAAFPDYLFLNETNVGVNKANYFLQRKIDHRINLSRDGRVEEKLTIAYENQSQSEDWPAGTYKTYLRLYLPQGAKVTSILITDPKNSSLWLPFEWRYFDISEDHNKALFGFFFEVPIQTKRAIEIKYELAQRMDFSQRLNAYLLLVQKQPGAHPSDYTLNFAYPENFVPVRVIPSAIVGQQQLLTSDKLIKDLIFQLDLAH